MNKQPPPLLTRIYTWIYGVHNFRENNYDLLAEHHRPKTECWYEGTNCLHASHVSDHNPNLGHLASLGNYLSDRINWLFEMIGKLNVTQSEIANELNLKLDLVENTLKRIDEQIPTNFSDAFIHMYESICDIKRHQEKMFHDMELLNQEIHVVSIRLSALEKATGAEFCGNP